jgi:hypothetical protein
VSALRDGDIYSWRWRDDARHADRAPYRSYHCRSRIAEVHKGRLYDTFWSIPSEGLLNEADVILTFLGNVREMKKISEWQLPYYRDEDIVDMRHSNNSGADIWLKPGAVLNADKMREHAEYKRQRALDEIQSRQRTVERLDEALAQIEKGNLDAVRF